MPLKNKIKKHTVRATLNVIELTKAGTSLDLKIYADGEIIGTIVLGRGALYWYGPSKQKGKRIPWDRFAKMMDKLASGD
jgi:hypothetical protein